MGARVEASADALHRRLRDELRPLHRENVLNGAVEGDEGELGGEHQRVLRGLGGEAAGGEGNEAGDEEAEGGRHVIGRERGAGAGGEGSRGRRTARADGGGAGARGLAGRSLERRRRGRGRRGLMLGGVPAEGNAEQLNCCGSDGGNAVGEALLADAGDGAELFARYERNRAGGLACLGLFLRFLFLRRRAGGFEALPNAAAGAGPLRQRRGGG